MRPDGSEDELQLGHDGATGGFVVAKAPDEHVWGNPVAILVYDANNPAFVPEGRIAKQFWAVQTALREEAVLKRATWQSIVKVLQEQGDYEALTTGLGEKYGIGT